MDIPFGKGGNLPDFSPYRMHSDGEGYGYDIMYVDRFAIHNNFEHFLRSRVPLSLCHRRFSSCFVLIHCILTLVKVSNDFDRDASDASVGYISSHINEIKASYHSI